MSTDHASNPILSRPVGLALLAAFVMAAGCDAGETADRQVDAPPPALPGAEVTEATVALEPVNDSGVFGQATALHGEEDVTVLLEVQGLPAAGEYAAHIHSGTCADGGPVAVGLNPVVANEAGHGTSTSTLDMGEMDHDQSHFFQVHSAEGPPVACGDMEVDPGMEPR
jgi:hypothetical protein